jgi:hypothetical protein
MLRRVHHRASLRWCEPFQKTKMGLALYASHRGDSQESSEEPHCLLAKSMREGAHRKGRFHLGSLLHWTFEKPYKTIDKDRHQK